MCPKIKSVGKVKEKPVEKEEQKEQIKTEQQVKVSTVSSIVDDRLKELGALWISKPIQCDYDSVMGFRIAILPNRRRKNPPHVIALVRASEKSGYISSIVPISPRAFNEIEKQYKEAIVQYEKLKPVAEAKKKELEVRQLIAKMDKETIALLKQLLKDM